MSKDQKKLKKKRMFIFRNANRLSIQTPKRRRKKKTALFSTICWDKREEGRKKNGSGEALREQFTVGRGIVGPEKKLLRFDGAAEATAAVAVAK